MTSSLLGSWRVLWHLNGMRGARSRCWESRRCSVCCLPQPWLCVCCLQPQPGQQLQHPPTHIEQPVHLSTGKGFLIRSEKYFCRSSGKFAPCSIGRPQPSIRLSPCVAGARLSWLRSGGPGGCSARGWWLCLAALAAHGSTPACSLRPEPPNPAASLPGMLPDSGCPGNCWQMPEPVAGEGREP